MGSIQAGVPLSRVNTNAGADDDDDDDHDDDSRLAKPAKFVRVLTLKPVHLEEDCPITTFSGKKKKHFFANGPITIINLRAVSREVGSV